MSRQVLSQFAGVQEPHHSFGECMQWETHDVVIAAGNARHEGPTNALQIKTRESNTHREHGDPQCRTVRAQR